jgi:hypothetical protein
LSSPSAPRPTGSIKMTPDTPDAPPMPRSLHERARAAHRYAGRFVLVLHVYLLLIGMRGVIAACSLPWITRRLGTQMEETPTLGVPADQLRYAHRVAWAIRRAAPKTPTNSNCYPQALTAWWLLHRKRIPTTFYYGAAFDDDRSALEAHVWLRCGNLIVTGGGPHRRFAPLTWFADIPRGVSPARQQQGSDDSVSSGARASLRPSHPTRG